VYTLDSADSFTPIQTQFPIPPQAVVKGTRVIPGGDLVALLRGSNPVGARDISCMRLERSVPRELKIAFRDESGVSFTGYSTQAISHYVAELTKTSPIEHMLSVFISTRLLPTLNQSSDDSRDPLLEQHFHASELSQLLRARPTIVWSPKHNCPRSSMQSPIINPFPFKDADESVLYESLSLESPNQTPRENFELIQDDF